VRRLEKIKQGDCCEVYCYDEEKVKRVKKNIEEHDTQDIVKVFKALADDTRLKVAYALCEEEELCVCDIANIIGSTTATASHHLRLLRNMGLARYRKEGKLVFYSLNDEQLKQLIMLAFTQRKGMKV
jgi:DNA-binding transcriptional ArsR family regulator